MRPRVFLSAALHFDFELASDPEAFDTIVATLIPKSPDEELLSWVVDSKNYAPPPSLLDLDRLLAGIATGSLSVAAIESSLGTAEPRRLMIAADVGSRMERSRSQTKCRYDFKAVFGDERLDELSPQVVLDALISFADAVDARAGVVHWADTATYASCLASCSESSTLSREQSSHISDLMYWQPRWGDVIRGPQWGTFLGSVHVERLGGIARIERESGCVRVAPFNSGGAFLQATPIDAPIVEGHDDGGVLERLARFLAPVMDVR